ncbi:hypothetical protein GHU20_13400 [Pseudomonas aeruginosa]|nr:hypothetical protein [Pseudomonas aeruginosa]
MLKNQHYLAPCPFCGCDLDAQWNRPNPKARCRTDGCKGRQLPVLNLDQADDIAAWNHRPLATNSTADAVAVQMCIAAGLDVATADALVWRIHGWLSSRR